MLPSPPPSAPEVHIEIEMQPPPPINVQPSPPSPRPLPMQPPPLSPYTWQWRRYVTLLEMCFFLTLVIGFGALLYLLFCVVVQIVTGNDMQLCYDFF